MVPVLVTGAMIAMAGCTDGGVVTPSPSATEFTPEVTDAGAVALAGIPECADIGKMFLRLTDGLELTLDSPGDAAVFCDWADAGDESRAFSIEVLASADPVPDAATLTASGAMVVDAAPVADAGGIAYVVATDAKAYALTVVLPTHSASVSVMNLGSGPEEFTVLTTGLSALLGLPDS
jgi:hypothetical protein